MIRTVVYGDEFFLLNLLVDYLLLLGTARLTHASFKRLRLLAGALLGAAYALGTLFWPSLGQWFLALPVGALLALTAFGARAFVRRGLTLLLLSAALAGGMQLLGGAAPLDFGLLAVSVLVFYCVLRFFFSGSMDARTKYVKVKVTLGEREAEFTALVDTGNALRDPVNQLPVLVAEWDSVKRLFPWEVDALFSPSALSQPESLLATLADTSCARLFHLIPYRAVGKHSMLLCFRPGRVVVDGREMDGAEVALLPGTLSGDRTYSALIGVH